MIQHLTRALALVLLTGLGTTQAQETITLRIHHFLPPTSTTHAGLLEPWAEAVEADSDGRIQVEIYPSMQLGGKPPQLYDQARDGVVDAVWTVLGYNAGRFPVSEVFELPFVARDAEATSQAAHDFAQRHLRQELRGVEPLLVHTHAPGTFHLQGHQVTRMEDLAGLKIRTPSRTATEALSALGAQPVGMPVPEVSQALSMAVVDGAVLPWEVARPLRIHEVTDHHTQFDGPGIYTLVFLFGMNQDRYRALPEDLRAVIDRHSGMDLAARVGRMWDEAEELGRQLAVEKGNAITTLSPEETERWREATRPVVEAWVADMDRRGLDGRALLEEARGLIEQYRQP